MWACRVTGHCLTIRSVFWVLSLLPHQVFLISLLFCPRHSRDCAWSSWTGTFQIHHLQKSCPFLLWSWVAPALSCSPLSCVFFPSVVVNSLWKLDKKGWGNASTKTFHSVVHWLCNTAPLVPPCQEVFAIPVRLRLPSFKMLFLSVSEPKPGGMGLTWDLQQHQWKGTLYNMFPFKWHIQDTLKGICSTASLFWVVRLYFWEASRKARIIVVS